MVAYPSGLCPGPGWGAGPPGRLGCSVALTPGMTSGLLFRGRALPSPGLLGTWWGDEDGPPPVLLPQEALRASHRGMWAPGKPRRPVCVFGAGSGVWWCRGCCLALAVGVSRTQGFPWVQMSHVCNPGFLLGTPSWERWVGGR